MRVMNESKASVTVSRLRKFAILGGVRQKEQRGKYKGRASLEALGGGSRVGQMFKMCSIPFQ